MTAKIDHWAGTGYRDHQSSNGSINLREEAAGEVFRMTSAEYWHLNRSFDSRSIFYGSGIKPFIDHANRFLALRDAAVILLFDYYENECWHASAPWRYELNWPPPEKVVHVE